MIPNQRPTTKYSAQLPTSHRLELVHTQVARGVDRLKKVVGPDPDTRGSLSI